MCSVKRKPNIDYRHDHQPHAPWIVLPIIGLSLYVEFTDEHCHVSMLLTCQCPSAWEIHTSWYAMIMLYATYTPFLCSWNHSTCMLYSHATYYITSVNPIRRFGCSHRTLSLGQGKVHWMGQNWNDSSINMSPYPYWTNSSLSHLEWCSIPSECQLSLHITNIIWSIKWQHWVQTSPHLAG